jgi:type I restriction enzyme M protein
VLIDASKLGEEYKEGNNQKRRLLPDEINRIVSTFQNKLALDDFSVSVTFDEICNRSYSLSAGQYFDTKIEYTDITEEEFNNKMSEHCNVLTKLFEQSHIMEKEILVNLKSISYNNN